MDALYEAEARKRVWIRATLVRLDLPGGSCFLTDGGFVIWNGDTYYGRHPTLGLFSSVSGLTSGIANQTTRVDVRILPKSLSALSLLNGATIQGCRVRVWRGAVDFQTGEIVGEPTQRFDGEVDLPKLQIGMEWGCTLECGTQSARQLEPNADWRQNHAFHVLRWPEEMGLLKVSGVTKAVRSTEWRT